jgi:Beta-propeller repeat
MRPRDIIFVLILSIFGVGLASHFAYAANPTIVWTASSTTGAGYRDALDSSGNVYVTGYNYGGVDYFLTVKYGSSSGAVGWTASSSVSAYDQAFDIAVDSSTNVYAAGETYTGSPSHYAFRTIKYNSSGGQVWAVNYYNSSMDDTGQGVAVDSSGNVYVEGHVSPNGFRTIKYNSSGSVVWNVATSTGASATGYGVAVDSSGNVYATGALGSYFGTIKYNSSGSQIWTVTSTLNGGPDAAYHDAVDSSGNVYVTGCLYDETVGYCYFGTIKYNSSGTMLWKETWGYGGSDNYAEGIAVDSSGNVYVTGYVYDSVNVVNLEGDTIKYNSSGSQIWHVTYSGNFEAEGVAVDSSNNVYVSGNIYTGPTLGTVYLVIKYKQQCSGPFSFSFTDPTLTSGTTLIRAVHVNELRSDVNQLRSDAGLAAYSFTDPTLTPGTTLIRAVHINDLRTALAAVYTACSSTAPTYTDATLTPGSSLIRAIDISQLRTNVQNAP